MRPFPSRSILSVLSVPLLSITSIPVWASYFQRQIAMAPDQPYASDPGVFVGFAMIFAVVITATFAAFPGMILAWLAGRRNERWKWLRVFAWVLNGTVALVGGWGVVDFFIKAPR